MRIGSLTERLDEIPRNQGVYVVVSWEGFQPEFLAVGSGGAFKGKEPNVDPALLRERWVPTSIVQYIGKAELGKTARRGLRKRLHEYVRFGRGEPVGHRGGRLIWQIAQAHEFSVAWLQTVEDPDGEETRLLKQFRSDFGSLPFANLATKGA
jgi:hypothetical protein